MLALEGEDRGPREIILRNSPVVGVISGQPFRGTILGVTTQEHLTTLSGPQAVFLHRTNEQLRVLPQIKSQALSMLSVSSGFLVPAISKILAKIMKRELVFYAGYWD